MSKRPNNVLPFKRGRKRGNAKLGIVKITGAGALIGAALGIGSLYLPTSGLSASGTQFQCASPYAVDGDTLRCGKRRVRLQGIDAPELPGHCRQGRSCTPGDPVASTESLRRLVAGKVLQCAQTDIDSYGRTVARCKAGDLDLSCAQIKAGHAVHRYGAIWCGV